MVKRRRRGSFLRRGIFLGVANEDWRVVVDVVVCCGGRGRSWIGAPVVVRIEEVEALKGWWRGVWPSYKGWWSFGCHR